MSEIKQDRFKDQDGVELFFQYRAQPKSKVAVVISHGLGEHSGRYQNIFGPLADKGYSFFALDHRGHGFSGGNKGCIDSFDQFTDGVKNLVEITRERTDAKKVFLLGHSLGGLIAAQYALRFQDSLDGLILSGPLFKLSLEVNPAKAAVGRLLSRFMPYLTMDNNIDPSLISHDEKAQKAYTSDPLVHSRVSTRLFTEMIAAMKNSLAQAKILNIPALIMHGGDDKLTHPDGSRIFFRDISSGDKELKIYDGFFHEIMNEIEKDIVIADIMQWIEARS